MPDSHSSLPSPERPWGETQRSRREPKLTFLYRPVQPTNVPSPSPKRSSRSNQSPFPVFACSPRDTAAQPLMDPIVEFPPSPIPSSSPEVHYLVIPEFGISSNCCLRRRLPDTLCKQRVREHQLLRGRSRLQSGLATTRPFRIGLSRQMPHLLK